MAGNLYRVSPGHVYALAVAGIMTLQAGCSNSSSEGDMTQVQQENEELRTALAGAIAQRDAAELRAREAGTRIAAAPDAAAMTSQSPATNSYTVRAGDTLSHIALRFYKDATRWPEIHEANLGVIGEDPARLKVGMKLTIPQ